MTSADTPFARRCAFDDQALDTFSDGFEREHRLHRGDGRSNHALRILGHLAWTRRWMASTFLGAEVPSDLDAHFSRGANPGPEVDAMAAADLRAAFVDAGRVLRERLETIDESTASAPLPESVRLPDGSRTVGDALRFLHFHESFHEAARGGRALAREGGDRDVSEAPDRRRIGGFVEIRKRSSRRERRPPARDDVRHGLPGQIGLLRRCSGKDGLF